LSSVRWRRDFGFFSGTFVNGGVVERIFTDYPSLDPGTPIYAPGPFPVVTQSYKDQQSAKILSATNPSMAHVSVPTIVGELKELPMLIKGWGESLLKDIAKGHLSWRWGIKPMIGEAKNLLNLARAINSRVVMLQRLQTHGQISRRCSLLKDSYSVPIQTNIWLHASGCFVIASRTTDHSIKEWGSAQYFVKSDTVLPRYGDDATLNAMATRLSLGITSYELLVAAWELMPWSWFVDWFTNVGDIISAGNNTINLGVRNVCLMRRTTSRTKYELNRASTTSWVNKVILPSLEEERKERWNVSSTPVLSVTSMPLFEAKTWSILGSLAVLKGRR